MTITFDTGNDHKGYQRIPDRIDDNVPNSTPWCNELILKILRAFCFILFITSMYMLFTSSLNYEEVDNLKASNDRLQSSLSTTWSWDTYPQDICIPGQFR